MIKLNVDTVLVSRAVGHFRIRDHLFEHFHPMLHIPQRLQDPVPRTIARTDSWVQELKFRWATRNKSAVCLISTQFRLELRRSTCVPDVKENSVYSILLNTYVLASQPHNVQKVLNSKAKSNSAWNVRSVVSYEAFISETRPGLYLNAASPVT